MNSFSFLNQNIPTIFDKFPNDHINDVLGWGIPKTELHTELSDGTKKLLTMDLDYGNTCSLQCPHCFRRSGFDNIKLPLTHDEIIGYISDAKKLGLKFVKILGRGEPFENPNFLGFLRQVSDMGIHIAIFTKGHVLGSDNLCSKYYAQYSIYSCKKLVQELKMLNTSILLGFNSFNKSLQESFIGRTAKNDNQLLQNYVDYRNQALINLVEAGFNNFQPYIPTRLAMISAPIKPENLNEIFKMYKWARTRNIYMLSCPTTLSGKGIMEYTRVKNHFENYIPQLIELYTKIYIWAIKSNLITFENFIEDGVSLYPGCHVCNQTAAGFYLNLSGQVNQCPGRCDQSTIFSRDIRKDSMIDIWKNCTNYKRAYSKKFNFHCVARDNRSLPKNFYQKIFRNILDHFNSQL